MLTLGFYQYKVSAEEFARDNGANADTVAFALGQGVTETVGDIALGAATGGLGLVKHCGTTGAKMLKVVQGVMKAADAVHTAKAAHDMVVNGDPSFAVIALFKVGGHGVGMVAAKIRGPKCFIAGTQVLAQDENGEAVPTNIEQIEAGDLVWSRDEHTGDEGFKLVVETYIRETDELVHLSYRSEGSQETQALVGTPEHPFWSLTADAWVNMGELKVGELLSLGGPALSSSKGIATVTDVVLELLAEPVRVYNFQVQGVKGVRVAPLKAYISSGIGGRRFRRRKSRAMLCASTRRHSSPNWPYTLLADNWLPNLRLSWLNNDSTCQR